MSTTSGSAPLRYFALLRLTLVSLIPRLVLWIPFCLAYFLPLGTWSKVLVVFSPLLWYTVVGPVRIRYGATIAAYARDASAPLTLQSLCNREKPWHQSFLGRAQLLGVKVLPLIVLSAFILIPLWAMDNVFAALQALLGAPSWIASAIATVFAAIPRLIMGKPVWVDAGVLGGGLVLAVLFVACLALYLWGVFQTGAHRFGFERLPKKGAQRTLRRKNLLLWLPTLVLCVALCVVSYQELILLAANLLSVEAVFSVKFHTATLVLSGLMIVSYILILPLRRYNTALWAADHD